ncbi:galactose mutarotase-like domain-containing protein [Mycena floridula]|nr:galactose mutarotase-like domain-containing protein [Mycena floridula]
MFGFPLLFLASLASATLVFNDSSSSVSIANDRLELLFSKSANTFSQISLDGIDLLGSGGRLYYDCHCIPSGAYTPTADQVIVVNGTDSSGAAYVGIIASGTYVPTGQFFEKTWFVRDKETAIHHFTRAAYNNATVPILINFAELRSLFRPNSGIFTHLISDDSLFAPLPSAAAVSQQVDVQDATWYLGNTPNDPYVQQESDFFTKYMFANTWRNQTAHGMYSDGSVSNGIPFGAWNIMVNKETYFGGPTHSDLLVDGIVYDYIISNHHGDSAPNVSVGLDRTFGPVVMHFNSAPNASLHDLLFDAQIQARPSLNQFYDDIAAHVPGYVIRANRGTFQAAVNLPEGAVEPIAILALDGVDYQANAVDTTALQYWGEIDSVTGRVTIPQVKAGSYRLTIYAKGIFGDYIQDHVQVTAGKTTSLQVTWTPESHGKELWRIGVPDKSSGDFLHGDALTTSKPLHPAQYRNYWGAYDFPTDFPRGVNFTIGESNEATDFNYIHWSVFGPTFTRPTPVFDNLANWTINFNLPSNLNLRTGQATFTVQLAGVKTASGNTDVPNGDWSNLPLTYYFNLNPGLTYVVPYWHSSSCGVRSAAICYQVKFSFKFPGSWLETGWNQLILSLPHNATDTEGAVLPGTVYVQYDALRLELEE